MAKSRISITSHHDPDPVYYSLTQPEFDQLCDKAKTPERENVFFLIGLLIPGGLNLATGWPSPEQKVPVIFIINVVIVAISFILSLFQGKQWWAKRGGYNKFVKSLRDKPQVKLEIADVATGYVQTEQPQEANK